MDIEEEIAVTFILMSRIRKNEIKMKALDRLS